VRPRVIHLRIADLFPFCSTDYFCSERFEADCNFRFTTLLASRQQRSHFAQIVAFPGAFVSSCIAMSDLLE
jgi:hypothetical protein